MLDTLPLIIWKDISDLLLEILLTHNLSWSCLNKVLSFHKANTGWVLNMPYPLNLLSFCWKWVCWTNFRRGYLSVFCCTVQTFAYDGHVLYLFCPVGFPLPYVEDSVIPPSHSSSSPDLSH